MATEQLLQKETAQAGGANTILGRRALVLVVDDEQTIRKTMSEVLADEGYEVVTANNGMEALELVKKLSPDLVFLDIWMPGWDGIETLERIKSERPDTEVVMVSGHATIATALDATRRGALDFMEKPVDINSVVFAAERAIQNAVERKERQAKIIDVALNAGIGSPKDELSLSDKIGLFSHPGLLTTGAAGADVGQRSIKKSVVLYGQGLHSGQKSGLVLEPLPPDSGIHFSRIGDTRSTPAFVDFVDSTGFATTIRSNGVSAATIEHLMSALHAYRITNLLVKCNGEVPIFDGSAAEFCKVIESVGVVEQEGHCYELAVNQTVRYSAAKDGGKNSDGKANGIVEEIIIEPCDRFVLSYELNYPAPVGRQYFEYTYDGIESFKNEISRARTFGFMRDIERLQRAGLAAGGRLDNFILIGDDAVINTQLRYPEELVRHKILDCIGDLYLIGRPVRGKITARMTGHSDNVAILKAMKQFIACA